MNASSSSGQIITFYSYKGGTGRSMALANVAWILGSSGCRVLAVDWDLEAPGLHRYFYPFLLDKDLTATEGVIDFVSQFAIEAMTPSKTSGALPRDWYTRHANLNRYATTLDYKFPNNGRLDFIPAGRQGPAYSSKVNSFDWQTFYSRLGGGVVLEAAKQKMREDYQYVLIDSRTGVSDTSGISTVQMPDILVVCFTLNNQGIEGSAAVASSIAAQRKLATSNNARLSVFPVAMRVDPFEKNKLDLRKAYARTKFEDFPEHLSLEERERFRGEVQFPYVPYYAYEEILATFGDKSGETNTLLQSAERLTAYLTGQRISRLEPPDDEVRQRVLLAYERRPAQPEQHDVFLLYSEADESWAAQLAGQLSRETVKGGKLKLFFGPRDIRPGEAVEAKLQAALANSRNIVAVLSPAALQSEFFQKQLEQVVSQRQSAGSTARVLPLRLDQCEIPGFLDRFAHIDFPRHLLFRAAIQSSAENLAQESEQFTADAKAAFQRLLAVIKDEPLPYAGPDTIPVGAKPASRTSFKPEAPIKEATQILQGTSADPKTLLGLARNLKAAKKLWLARKILNKALADPAVQNDRVLNLKLQQELVLCTYKDPDLPTDWRLDEALRLLAQTTETLATTRNQETLGLAGAIHKRKWEFDGQIQHLERSLSYYDRGYQLGPETDFGYTAINAAFVLDLLASLEAVGAAQRAAHSQTVRSRREEAARIREALISKLPPLAQKLENQWLNQEWWFLVTVAEAYFGLRNHVEAQAWLQRAAALPKVPPWEYESTARQLATLARIHDGFRTDDTGDAASPGWQVLANFLGKDLQGVRIALLGKMGLALSGGGFRASLFHIGVLARLAELDVLRHVEVLSCVSGGSVIGAHYYLEVRKLLEEKPDSEITGEDYVQLVDRLARDFLAGVQRNLRTRVAASYLSNLKMLFLPNYSRTERLGELLEKEIFSRVNDGEGARRWLTKLFIRPKGEAPDFAPKYENWRRQAKAPILILNATTLNTGHNWQFTASWMGEPPTAISSEVDGNERLRRVYYEDAPPPHDQIRLGKAVAASACVPGLFDPINLAGLYRDRLVRLVDGGVHDNQGTVSLLEQECTLLLVSDASGQMDVEKNPGNNPLSVPLRSNSILMARVREAEYLELKARRRSFLLRGLMFLHLKKDLPSDPVDWLNCLPSNQSAPTVPKADTSYGIRKDIQQALAGLRTDFDSFSDAEAFALMTSGYRMAEREFATGLPGIPVPSTRTNQWKFLELVTAMRGAPQPLASYDRLLEMLRVGKNRAFKAWRLSRSPRNLALTGAGIVALAWAGSRIWPDVPVVYQLVSWVISFVRVAESVLLWYLALLLITGCVAVAASKLRAPSERLSDLFGKMLAGFGMSVLGSPLAWLHLRFFEKSFLRSCSLESVLSLDRSAVPLPSAARAKVFLSSTYTDLKEFRDRVQRALSREQHLVLGTKDFVAEHDPLQSALEEVAACDIFLAIIAWRYGFVPDQDNTEQNSLVELEYRRARQLGKDCLIFLLDDDTPWPPSMIEKGAAEQRLNRFRAALRVEGPFQYFKNVDDLEKKVLEAIARRVEAKAANAPAV